MSKIITVNIKELKDALSNPEASEHHDVLVALCNIFNGIYREIVNREKVEQSITVEFALNEIVITRYASHEVYKASDTFYWYEREQISGVNWTTSFHLTPIGTWVKGYNYPIAELYITLINKIKGLDVICKEMAGTKVKITP